MKKTLLNNLAHDIGNIDISNMNIVLEGGGFNGAYEIGVLMLIKKLENKSVITINKISGVSIGSVAGLLFLLDKLHYYEKYYHILREEIHKSLCIKNVDTLLRKIIDKISEKVFEKIKHNKLYISYYNLHEKQHITKSKYESKQDLLETILKSIHVPFITSNNKLTHNCLDNNEYIDGLYPFIFSLKEKMIESKTLYVCINQINSIHNCYNTKNENTPISRILHGILDCYDLLKYNKPSTICSFVEDWGISNIIYYKIKSVILHVIVYLISYITICSRYISNIRYGEIYLSCLMNWFRQISKYILVLALS